MNNVLVLGGHGWIGSKIVSYLNCESSTRYLEDFDDILFEIDRLDPDVVINAIGNTGGNVDECENDVSTTLHSNSLIPIAVAEVCARADRKLIHISSGCIYTPHDYKPIKEDEPQDYSKLFYSRSKIYAEKSILWLQENGFPSMMVIRLRVPLDDIPHKKNILTKILGYKKILNVPNSITYIPEFLRALKHLINIDATGIYNISLQDPIYYEDLIFKYYDAKCERPHEFTLITPEELNLNRTNLVLSIEKLKATGFKPVNTELALGECINNYISNESKNDLEN